MCVLAVFLINVVRVLLTKLHPAATQHASVAVRKAARAALILVSVYFSAAITRGHDERLEKSVANVSSQTATAKSRRRKLFRCIGKCITPLYDSSTSTQLQCNYWYLTNLIIVISLLGMVRWSTSETYCHSDRPTTAISPLAATQRDQRDPSPALAGGNQNILYSR